VLIGKWKNTNLRTFIVDTQHNSKFSSNFFFTLKMRRREYIYLEMACHSHPSPRSHPSKSNKITNNFLLLYPSFLFPRESTISLTFESNHHELEIFAIFHDCLICSVKCRFSLVEFFFFLRRIQDLLATYSNILHFHPTRNLLKISLLALSWKVIERLVVCRHFQKKREVKRCF